MIWKLYFLIFLLFIVSNWLDYVSNGLYWYHLFFVLSDVILLIGIFGYSFKRKIFYRSLWQMVLTPMVFVGLLGVMLITPEKEVSERFNHIDTLQEIMLILILVFLFVGPALVALCLYSYKSLNLWRAEADL